MIDAHSIEGDEAASHDSTEIRMDKMPKKLDILPKSDIDDGYGWGAGFGQDKTKRRVL